MLLKTTIVQGIVDGRIRCVFRRWAAPRAKAGGRQRTVLGELCIDAVTQVDAEALGPADAAAGGYPDLESLQAELAHRAGHVYRIDLHYAGPDPRVALRGQAGLSEGEVVQLRRQLARKDRAGPWTVQTLRLIQGSEGVRAVELAEQLGHDKAKFKQRVRQLKELGLTISLKRGYALSARGRALLDALNGTP